VGRLPRSGDRTNDYHREGIFLGLEGCSILALGGLGIGLSASIAGARITPRRSEGEVVGQYHPPRLYPHRLVVGLFVRFVIDRG